MVVLSEAIVNVSEHKQDHFNFECIKQCYQESKSRILSRPLFAVTYLYSSFLVKVWLGGVNSVGDSVDASVMKLVTGSNSNRS